MKTNRLLFAALVAFAIASTVAAQIPGAAPAAVALTGTAAILAGLIPVITPLFSLGVTALVKYAAPHIPGYLLPIIASITGLLPDYISHLATGAGTNTIAALLLGLSATGLHQISVQLKPAAPAPTA